MLLTVVRMANRVMLFCFCFKLSNTCSTYLYISEVYADLYWLLFPEPRRIFLSQHIIAYQYLHITQHLWKLKRRQLFITWMHWQNHGAWSIKESLIMRSMMRIRYGYGKYGPILPWRTNNDAFETPRELIVIWTIALCHCEHGTRQWWNKHQESRVHLIYMLGD